MWSAVELREIRVFLTVAAELHFGRAAEALLVTPSSVSQTVRTLEARIGGRLFDRTSRRVALSPLGRRFHDDVSPAYEEMRRAYEGVRELAGGVSGVLRIGMYSPVNGAPHLVEIITTFGSRHPDCHVEVLDTNLTDPLVGLRRGEFDLIATRLPLGDPGLTIGPVLSCEERVVLVAVGHRLAGRESIEYEELADETVTDVPGMPRELMDDFVPPCTPSGRLIRRYPVRNYGDAVLRVATGEIVHPTVRSFLEHVSRPGLVAVPIRDLPRSRTALIGVAPRGATALRAFARAARDVLERHDEPWAREPQWVT